jgi:phosphotransferase system HPr (HPr) family protein
MEQIAVVIHHPVGLHARPAALLVEAVSNYPGRVQLRKGGREANAKSILSVLSLGVKQGDEVILLADGEGASGILADLRNLIESNFGEPA